jgi:hypothetical protein
MIRRSYAAVLRSRIGREKISLKSSLSVTLKYSKKLEGEYVYTSNVITCKSSPIITIEDVDAHLDSQFEYVLERFDEGFMEESGWRFEYVMESRLMTNRYTQAGGAYIETPDYIKRNTCNYKHKDPLNNHCFLHACVVAMNYNEISKRDKNPGRESHYNDIIEEKEALFRDIKYPIYPRDGNTLQKFEERLGKKIMIYEYWEDGKNHSIKRLRYPKDIFHAS